MSVFITIFVLCGIASPLSQAFKLFNKRILHCLFVVANHFADATKSEQKKNNLKFIKWNRIAAVNRCTTIGCLSHSCLTCKRCELWLEFASMLSAATALYIKSSCVDNKLIRTSFQKKKKVECVTVKKVRPIEQLFALQDEKKNATFIAICFVCKFHNVLFRSVTRFCCA